MELKNVDQEFIKFFFGIMNIITIQENQKKRCSIWNVSYIWIFITLKTQPNRKILSQKTDFPKFVLDAHWN